MLSSLRFIEPAVVVTCNDCPWQASKAEAESARNLAPQWMYTI